MITNIRPIPPLGPYPHARLWGQTGMTPKSASIRITSKIVPSIVLSPVKVFENSLHTVNAAQAFSLQVLLGGAGDQTVPQETTNRRDPFAFSSESSVQSFLSEPYLRLGDVILKTWSRSDIRLHLDKLCFRAKPFSQVVCPGSFVDLIAATKHQKA